MSSPSKIFIKGYVKGMARERHRTKDFVYELRHNNCIHESAYYTVSIHRTKLGAYKALRSHRRQAYNEWKELYSDTQFIGRQVREFFHDQRWYVAKSEIQP